MINLGILSLDHPHSRGNHIPALKYLGNQIRVSAIYHDDGIFARPYIEQFGAKYYADRDALLADPDIDAVLITSKNYRHARDCIAAAQAGKDIFCDKPIAISVEDGIKIRDAVKKAGVEFLTTFPVRFNPAVRQLKNKIDNGELGTITAVMATNHGSMYEPGAPDWVKSSAQNGGGCLIDHCVHVADIIRWITGQEFEDVKAVANHALKSDIDAEDLAMLHGHMTDGCIYQIDASWSRRGCDKMWGDVTFRIVGTKGSASLDIYNHQRMEVHSQGEMQIYYPNNIVREHGEIFCDYCSYREHGTELIGAGVTAGLRTIELAYAGYDSLKTGSTVQVTRN